MAFHEHQQILEGDKEVKASSDFDFTDEYDQIDEGSGFDIILDQLFEQEGQQGQLEDRVPETLDDEEQNRSDNLGKRKKRERSAFHNFQKHLVTTIRRNMKTRILKKSGDVSVAALEIWSVFMKEKLYTKQFLLLTLGLLEVKKRDKFPQMLQKYRLMHLYQKYGNYQFYQAQRILKERVTNLVNKLDQRKILYKRRLQKKNEFVAYVKQFAQQLQSQQTVNFPQGKIKRQVRNSCYQSREAQQMQPIKEDEDSIFEFQ